MNAPFKISWKTEIFPVLLIAASLVFGWYLYGHLPERVVSHWNFQGVPDGYSGKFLGSYLGPIVLAGMYLLFLVIPFLDPRRDRYAEFSGVYAIFRGLLLAVMAVIFAASGLYNLGYNVNINYVIPVAIGILFLVMGNYMGKLKSNWFVGIRTPWTLSSENVWNRTHRFGGWMFMLFGVLIMLAPFLPYFWGLVAFIAGIALVVFGSFLYSYIAYRQEQGSNRQP